MAIGSFPIVGTATRHLCRSIFLVVLLLPVLVGILLNHAHAEGHVGVPTLHPTRVHGLLISFPLQPSYLLVHLLGVLADLRELELHEPEAEGDDPPND